jgi:hypothetical protein
MSNWLILALYFIRCLLIAPAIEQARTHSKLDQRSGV